MSVSRPRRACLPLRLALASSLVLSAAPAQAEDWRLVSWVGNPRPSTIWLVDADTMKFAGNHVRFWLDTRSRTADEDGSNRVLQLIEADCESMSYEGLQTQTYSAGTPLENIGVMKRSFAAPGTAVGGILERICGGNYSQPISEKNDPEALTRRLFGEQWFKKSAARKRSGESYYPR